MKFFLVNRFFWPDESATALLLTDLAEDLVGRGHEVHVFTSRQLYNQPKARLSEYEIWQEVAIHRLPSTAYGRRSFKGRLLDLATFHWSLRSLKHFPAGPDAWFVMTDPPFVLNSVLKLQKKLGGRVIHHVDDLYPDLAVALGELPANGLLLKRLQRLAIDGLMKCDRILALGQCMAGILGKKLNNRKDIAITVPWADGKKLSPLRRSENRFRKELGVSEQDFLVMYSGNIGKGHLFDTILECAKEFDNQKNIYFVFIGDGAKRQEIENFCKQHNLRNCKLLPYQPRARLRESLSAGDVHLISLNAKVQGLIVPSKLAGILAVGRPALFLGASQNSVAQAIKGSGCGFVVAEGDKEGFKNLILMLAEDEGYRQELGRRARNLFESEYARSSVVPRIIAYLENG